jgi:hypothetical protein
VPGLSNESPSGAMFSPSGAGSTEGRAASFSTRGTFMALMALDPNPCASGGGGAGLVRLSGDKNKSSKVAMSRLESVDAFSCCSMASLAMPGEQEGLVRKPVAY